MSTITRSEIDSRTAHLDGLLAAAQTRQVFQLPPGIMLDRAGEQTLCNWLSAALNPAGPYPILIIRGDGATGKSRMLHALLKHLGGWSPTPQPRSVLELVAWTEGERLVAIDDVVSLPKHLCDGLTLISRGGLHVLRRPYRGVESCMVHALPVVIASPGFRTTRHNRDFLAGCTTITLSGVRQ